jgi:hypothetical protein
MHRCRTFPEELPTGEYKIGGKCTSSPKKTTIGNPPHDAAAL